MVPNGKALSARRCIVTGGGSGIGRGIALALAAQGARVAVTGRRVDKLAETAALAEAGGFEVVTQAMDVTDRESVAAGMDAVAERFAGLDVLVNNAGVGGPNACALDGPDHWDVIIRTNLDGMFFCTREAMPHFDDGGRIVNVSSVVGKFGVPGYTAYAASKFGVIGFTKSLALECAPRGITVNAVCPGWVETDMAREGMENLAKAMSTTYDEARAQALGMVPLGEIVQPDEVGELVAYLCSHAARNMTGQAISLCGGSTMSPA